MADRQVTRTAKDRYGDITKLCNPGAAWSPRSKSDAIDDIENDDHTYYVLWSDGLRTEVQVVHGANGKYLRTVRDDTLKNNLGDLPDC